MLQDDPVTEDGPRGGILGVQGLIRWERGHPDPLYPWWLVGISDWGCAIWSLIDLRDPAGPMWSWDGNTHTLRQHDQTISDWLALWLEFRLEMPEGTEPPSAEEVRRRRAEWQAAHPGERLPSYRASRNLPG
jgi:hypothetical protein